MNYTVAEKLTDHELALLFEIIKKTSVDEELEGLYLSLRTKVFHQVNLAKTSRNIPVPIEPSHNGKNECQ